MLDAIIKYDRALFLYINNALAGRPNDIFLGGITLAGYAYFLVPVAFLFLYLKEKESFKENALYFSLALLIGAIAVQSIKVLVGRPRPLKDMALLVEAGKVQIHNLFYPLQENSFPSGHTQLAFTVATFLAIVNGEGKFYFFLFAFLEGLSRIYVGVHYPLDVIFGAMIGFGASYIVVRFFKLDKGFSRSKL